MTEQEIRKELEFARLARDILESIPGMLAVDSDGNITFISRGLARTVGRNPTECIGKPVGQILPVTRMGIMAKRMKDGVEPSTQFTFLPESGQLRSRVTVYRDGKRKPENAVGVVAFSAADDESGQTELLRATERLRQQNELYRSHMAQIYAADRDLREILGISPEVRAMKELIRKVASSTAAVCIVGETGTGKELVANAIHRLSKRAHKPFVKINCAAIPKDLMESELFGYEPGAFTGASRQGKLGKFEVANGGTLLLDEIGEMPLSLQAKLLRVLQEGEVERVGGTTPVSVNVRVLCSTNRDLRKMAAEGTFRSDLYYRVNTMEIEVPPLRTRTEDIPSLAQRFMEEANRRNGLSVSGMTEAANQLLLRYSWPGNIRELEHAIERACILCGAGELDVRQFAFLLNEEGLTVPEKYRGITASSRGSDMNIPETRPTRLRDAETERRMIISALDACGGSRLLAAKQLGIARSTLYEKLKKYGLQ